MRLSEKIVNPENEKAANSSRRLDHTIDRVPSVSYGQAKFRRVSALVNQQRL
ncbi:MAG: hypothetical protein JWM68_2998 [Verrucomicrobiales bacterium]|nr:hypothetical protein [Verrucomicrobiales bacterium]